MSVLRCAAAQLNTVVGDLGGNVGRITAALREAAEAGVDLCVFPELTITGYPPEDLLLKPGFVADNVSALETVAAATGECTAVVGFVEAVGSTLANAAAVCREGRIVGVYRKRRLPNYGVFDEQRWFVAGSGPLELFTVSGVGIGVSICEDVWLADGPVADYGRNDAGLVVNLNASPYSRGRRSERVAMLRERVAESGVPILYVNQVGGQDELVFDGASLMVSADGTLLGSGREFEEDLVVVDIEIRGVPASERAARPPVVRKTPEPLGDHEEVYAALVLGTRDYVSKNGFLDVVIGLSGGIDSALVATIAVDALGPDRVRALAMPSRYSSEGSVSDARAVAERLGITLTVVPIERAHTALGATLEELFGGESRGLTDENLQSRLRGLILMAVSNEEGCMVLTTGNKSEMATGYSTLYGDSAGGFAVIKDVPKTLVYELCRHRNERSVAEGTPPPIPDEVIDKPPSAELRPDQRDDQSLPPYPVLDPVLAAYVEQDRTAAELIADGFDPAVVAQVVRLVDGAEYKRRQMPPGVRISPKAFGRDRRMPITNRYRSTGA